MRAPRRVLSRFYGAGQREGSACALSEPSYFKSVHKKLRAGRRARGLLPHIRRRAACKNGRGFAAVAAGVAALQEPDWPARARALLGPERAFLTDGLRALGFAVCPSEANYLLFSGPEGLDAALLRQKIAIRSCANYPGLGPGWYRIAVRLHEENEALLAAMRRVKEELPWR